MGHRAVPRHPRLHAQRRGGAEGSVAVRRPPRRRGGVAARHPGRRSDRPRRLHRHRDRRRGPGHPAQRRSSRAACCRGSCTTPTRPAGRARRRPARPCAAASSPRPASAAWPGRCCPARRTQAELLAGVGDGLLVQDVAGLHSGVNPVSGDFSTGAEGLRIRGGELAEPVREFTIASTLQRMLLDVRGRRQRPRVAADERGRREPRHRRRHRLGRLTASTWPSCADRCAARRRMAGRPGEQVEVFVARGTADAGEGLRRRGRVAHLGRSRRASASGSSATTARASPTPARSTSDVIAETLAEARDNVAFGEPDECFGAGRARRRRGRSTRTCGTRRWSSFAADAKVELALALERAVHGPRSRGSPGVRTAVYGDCAGEAAIADEHRHAGLRAAARPASCRCPRWPSTATRPRSAAGSTSGREPDRARRRGGGGRRGRAGRAAVRGPSRCRRNGSRSCSSRGWRRPSSASPAAR